MSRVTLFMRSAVPLGLIVLAHSWSAETGEIKPRIVPIPASNSQPLTAAERTSSIREIIDRQGEKPARRQVAVPSAIGRKRDRHEKLTLLAVADKSASGQGALQRTGSQSKESSKSRQTKPVKRATPPAATAAEVPVSESIPPANSFTSGEQEASLPKSPSMLQMLEGREQDLVIAATIAVAFFSAGWLCGWMYHLRRDRIRRTKLRF